MQALAAPFSAADVERLRRSFMLGLNRDPLTLPKALDRAVRDAGLEAEAPLIALALAAQSQRFERPACAVPGGGPALAETPEAARLIRDDAREILPPPARRLLTGLLAAAKTTIAQHVMWAALARLNRRGLRLHPFDLPRFEPLLRANEDALGPAERAWLFLTAEADGAEPASLLNETIDASNWRSFRKPQRLAFLKEARLRDPAEGLALVEACFKEEPAGVRADLAEALETGLSPADQTFLESLEKDRAEKVRFNASRLLSRLPGTEAHAKRIQKALEALEIKEPGKIVFRPPVASKALAEAKIHELFEGLSLTVVAGLTGRRPEEFLGALTGRATGLLLSALIPATLAEGDENGIAALVDEVSFAALTDAVSLMRDSRAAFKPQACMAFARGFVRRLDSGAAIHGLSLADLGAMIGGPLPAALADEYLTSASWKRAVTLLIKEETNWRDKCDPEIAFYTALIMPSERMPQFLASLEAVPPLAARFAKDFAQFVLSLPGEDGALNSDKR
jgi:hypothetical protein